MIFRINTNPIKYNFKTVIYDNKNHISIQIFKPETIINWIINNQNKKMILTVI